MEIITKADIKTPTLGAAFTHYDTSRSYLMNRVMNSIEALGIDSIDLFLIHRPDPLMDYFDLALTLDMMVDQKLIKNYGVSNFEPQQLRALQKFCKRKIATNQIELSPIAFEHFKNHNLDLMQEMEMIPMYWSPLAGGRLMKPETNEEILVNEVAEELATKYDVSPSTIIYSWLLQHPANGVIVVGSSKQERLDEAIVAQQIHLSREDWYRLYLATGEMIIK